MPLKIHLIAVGKLKDSQLQKLEEEYLKRLKQVQLSIHEVKAFAEQIEKEGKEVCHKLDELGPGLIFLLSEQGELLNSVQFAKKLFAWEGSAQYKQILFILGGALGHAEEVKKRSSNYLSLSPLTFPHQMARVLFVEQLYRAQSIHYGHPYHH